MRPTETRLQRLEMRLLPPTFRPRLFFTIEGQEPTGYRCDAVRVERLPGESVNDLERRCAASYPKAISWMACYGAGQ